MTRNKIKKSWRRNKMKINLGSIGTGSLLIFSYREIWLLAVNGGERAANSNITHLKINKIKMGCVIPQCPDI
jgi:hypothetical protein